MPALFFADALAGFAAEVFAPSALAWDEARLDAWLTNPQVMIPEAFMTYRQAKPETRAAIIAYLKGLN